MKSKEIFDRIENIINDNVNKSDNSKTEDKTENEKKYAKTEFKDILYLLMLLFLDILKAPFKIVAKYLRDEIITAIKNDAKIFMLIMLIMGVLFVFYSVIWLFISIAVGVYFYDKGYTILISIIFSIGFQLVSIVLISLIALIASRKLKSLKMMKKLNKYII
jgi:hypothetical protein